MVQKLSVNPVYDMLLSHHLKCCENVKFVNEFITRINKEDGNSDFWQYRQGGNNFETCLNRCILDKDIIVHMNKCAESGMRCLQVYKDLSLVFERTDYTLNVNYITEDGIPKTLRIVKVLYTAKPKFYEIERFRADLNDIQRIVTQDDRNNPLSKIDEWYETEILTLNRIAILCFLILKYDSSCFNKNTFARICEIYDNSKAANYPDRILNRIRNVKDGYSKLLNE